MATFERTIGDYTVTKQTDKPARVRRTGYDVGALSDLTKYLSDIVAQALDAADTETDPDFESRLNQHLNDIIESKFSHGLMGLLYEAARLTPTFETWLVCRVYDSGYADHCHYSSKEAPGILWSFDPERGWQRTNLWHRHTTSRWVQCAKPYPLTVYQHIVQINDWLANQPLPEETSE